MLVNSVEFYVDRLLATRPVADMPGERAWPPDSPPRVFAAGRRRLGIPAVNSRTRQVNVATGETLRYVIHASCRSSTAEGIAAAGW